MSLEAIRIAHPLVLGWRDRRTCFSCRNLRHCADPRITNYIAASCIPNRMQDAAAVAGIAPQEIQEECTQGGLHVSWMMQETRGGGAQHTLVTLGGMRVDGEEVLTLNDGISGLDEARQLDAV